MFERFTDRARKVMQLANQEAQRFNHEYIGTEHILLGLVKEGTGVAANVLKNLDIDLRKIRLEVEKIVQAGPDMVTMGKLPQTPRAKKVIEYSMTFLARGVWGSLPIVTMSGPACTIFSTSRRIFRRSMSRFFKTLAATPVPSLTKPSRMCSVPIYSWLKRCASWLASCITLRARSVNRSYIGQSDRKSTRLNSSHAN